MFKITKESIKPLATDEATYYRGLRYYKEQAVGNVTWSKTNSQYHALVKGSNQYMVTINMNEKSLLEYTCNCPAHIKYEGACKHVIATLLFIEHYQECTEGRQPETAGEKTVFQILDYFDRQIGEPLYGETFQIKPHIEVPALLKGTAVKAFVSLSAGAGRLYKVPNIKKFLSALVNKEAIFLGKEFKYIPGESCFTKSSMQILSYLLEIYEIQEAVGSNYYLNVFTKSTAALTKNMLIKLLGFMEDTVFHLEVHNKVYEEVKVEKGNPQICFSLEMINNRIKMDYHDTKNIIPLAEDGSMLFSGNRIYLPDREFIINYIPFYQNLGNDREPLYFSGEQKDKFIEVVLPRIHETMKIDIPKSLQDKFVEEPLKINLYLDKYKSYIKAEVRFLYGNYELVPHSSKMPGEIIIIRNREEENDFLTYLERIHFIRSKDGLLLKNEEEIYEFLTDGIHEMTKKCTLYYSEDFKKISIRPAGQMSAAVKLSNNSSLLDLSISYEDIPVSELKDLFRSFQVKKKYYRLKDGSFVDFTTEQMDQAVQFFERLNITGKSFDQEQMAVPIYKAFDLDRFIAGNDSIHVQTEADYRELIESILKPLDTEYEVPKTICGTLRSYQITGFKWLCTLAENHLGGILADDMGLGKTLQAITYLVQFVEQGQKPHLIICPTSLVYNWQEEFEQFAPHIRVNIVNGAPELRQEIIESTEEYDIIITSYPLIRRDIECYEKISFHTVFLDESQFIKNAASQNARSVKRLNAIHRFALTGTPVENSLSELWSVFDFVMPGFLLSHTKFCEQYEKPIIRAGDEERLEDLLRRLHPFILRRIKQDVLTELPEKIETKMLTDLEEEQRKVYLSYLNSLREELFRSGQAEKENKMQILAALTRLRQICCHPATFLSNYKGGSGKLNVLMELTENILEGGHRILIFSQFTSMLNLIKAEMEKQKIEYFTLEGTTKAETRQEYVKRFNKGEKSVFLISLKAGGTGLNLTGADTVIHFDPWWNPAVENQATDRAHRIGQKHSVQVIKLIAKDTIEEKIYKLQQKKQKLADSVIQSKEVFLNSLNREELEYIFK